MTLTVNTQRISVKDPTMLVTGTTGVYTVKFELTGGLWDTCTLLTACFKKWSKSTVYSVALGSTLECDIPAEMLADTQGFQVGIFGSTSDINYNTIWSGRLAPDEGCIIGADPATPTQSIWNQIIEIMETTEGYASSAATSASSAATSASNAATSAATAVTTAESAVSTANAALAKVTGITANASTLESGSSATATVSTVDSHYNIAFGIPKGAKGDKGDTGNTGAAAGFDTPTITVDQTTGTPSATVTASGPDTAKVFAFAFSGVKGETGAKGDTGDTGDTGAAAGFGTPAATIDANVGTPSVTVTASGPNTAKVFTFDFKNLKGQKGDAGTGTGDMLASEYDSDSTVRNAGGIVAYVTSVLGTIETQLSGI